MKNDIQQLLTRIYPTQPDFVQNKTSHIKYKEYQELILRKFHNQENFQKEWTPIEDSLSKTLGVKAMGNTFGTNPSYTTKFISEERKGMFNIVKELVLHVSILGKYFTIEGSVFCEYHYDETKDWKRAGAQVAYFPYPAHGFEELYVKLFAAFKSHFPSHKFVPYNVSKRPIEGLQPFYLGINNATIYQGLFNNNLPLSDDVIVFDGRATLKSMLVSDS